MESVVAAQSFVRVDFESPPRFGGTVIVQEKMQILSSRLTPVTKFVLPGGFLAALPFLIFQIQSPTFGCWPAILWTALCGFAVWWTLPIKRIALRDDEFLISNYWKEVSVPASNLVKFSEDRGNRTPNITLFFYPPTVFGKKVRIVVPADFSRREFDRIVQILRQVIDKNAQPGGAANRVARGLSEL